MTTEREREVVHQIAARYGHVIDLQKTPGVLIEILRDFGAVLDGEGGAGGGLPAPPPSPPTTSSIAIAGPGSGLVSIDDLMRVVMQLRKETLDLHGAIRAITKTAG